MLCDRCGKQIAPGTVYCKNCGARVGDSFTFEDYATPEKKSKKIWFVFIGFICVISIGIAVILSILIHQESTLDYHQVANVNNGGQISYQKDTVFYVLPRGDKAVLYRANNDLDGTQALLTEPRIENLQMYAKELYFSTGSQIWKTSGERRDKSLVKEAEVGSMISKFFIVDQRILYLMDNNLYTCNLKGYDQRCMAENVRDFCVGGLKVFYAQNVDRTYTYQIKSCDFNGKGMEEYNVQKISTGSRISMVYVKGVLYIQNEQGICKVLNKSKGEEYVATVLGSPGNNTSFTICDNKLYYIRPLSQEEESDFAYNNGITYSNLLKQDSNLGVLYVLDLTKDDKEEIVSLGYFYPKSIYSTDQSVYILGREFNTVSREFESVQLKRMNP